MSAPTLPPVPAIDLVCGIWTEEALSVRPGWQDQFFAGKMKSKTDMKGVSLDDHLAQMAEAGIEKAFLFAPKVGRNFAPALSDRLNMLPLSTVQGVGSNPDSFS